MRKALIPLIAFLPVPALAQDIITIDATRLDTQIAETGTAISIITDVQLKNRALTSVIDALVTTPGISVNQTGAFGGVASVQIRGNSSDQTLVLRDGIPLGDPAAIAGGFDFTFLETPDIDRIEILRGAQSTLWGSDAIGGVINIISKTPDQGITKSAFAEYGSYQTSRIGAAASAANESSWIRGAISQSTSDGISKADAANGNTETDGYEALNISLRGETQLHENIRLSASLTHNDSFFDIDGFPPPDFTLADSSDTSASLQNTAAIKLDFDTATVENSLSVGRLEINRSGNFGGFISDNDGTRNVLRYQGTMQASPKNKIAFGAEYEKLEADGQKVSTKSLFALLESTALEDLTLTGGLRLDDHETFGSHVTGKIAAAIALNDTLTLRSSLGQGFKAPSLFQLTQSFGALPANADLQPEESFGFDIGAEWQTVTSAVSVSAFVQDTDNLITFAPNFRYENIAEVKTHGIEIAATHTLTPSLSADIAYTYTHAEDGDGERLIRLPRHSADMSLTWQATPQASLTLSAHYNGKETESPFVGENLKSWVRTDLAGRWQLTKKLEIYARGENLLDVDYQSVSGYGTPGRSGFVGIRISG